jgi:hypothetical protein
MKRRDDTLIKLGVSSRQLRVLLERKLEVCDMVLFLILTCFLRKGNTVKLFFFWWG